MPYENEHACRLKEPGLFQDDSFRRTKRNSNGKEYSIIMGKLKGETTMTEQAYRYGKDTWTAAEARGHCKSHKGSFEAAARSMGMYEVWLKSDGIFKPKLMIADDILRWFKTNTDDNGNVMEEIVLFKDAEIQKDAEGFLWTMSDYSVDRDFERIDPDGWDLKEYRKNPIVLWQHRADLPAIGLAQNVKVKDGKLISRIMIDDGDYDQLAVTVRNRVEKGIIKSGSVGFRSQKVELVEDQKKPEKLIHRKQTLVEFSIVNLPSNINATVDLGKIQNVEESRSVYDTLARLNERLDDLLRNQKQKSNYIEELLDFDREANGKDKRLETLLTGETDEGNQDS